MMNQFSTCELNEIKVAVERNDYMYRLGNNAVMFIFTYSDDNLPSFVLTKHNGAFTLTQFDNDGTTSKILENIISLESIIKNFKAAISEYDE